MPGRITVRSATTVDVEAMGDLHVRAWEWAYAGLVPGTVLEWFAAPDMRAIRLEAWRDTLTSPRPRSAWWVAERDGRVIGFTSTGPSRDPGAGPDTGELYALYLEPEVVGQGVARLLMNQAAQEMQGQGYMEATLWVLEGNSRGRRFYEAAGWRPDGATKADELAGMTLSEVRYRIALGAAAEVPVTG